MVAYVITNTVDGKKYVGATTQSLKNRYRNHLTEAKKGRVHPLYDAMRLYGEENFACEQIAVAASIEDLREMEKQLIVEFDSLAANGKGYNARAGGDSAYGYKLTDETRARMSKARAGKKRPEFAILVTIDGATKSLTDWGKFVGINTQTICKRYHSGVRGRKLIAPVNATKSKAAKAAVAARQT